MKTWSLLSFARLGALAMAAGCAQGVTGTYDAFDPQASDAGGASVDAGGAGSQAPLPVVTDAGSTPHTSPDAGQTTIDDAGVSEGPGANPQDSGDPAEDAGGATGGSSAIPTTCAQAHQKAGCCVGDELYYCNGSTTVTKKACTSGKVCGWDSSKSYYDCVASAGADPSGANPIACD